MVTIKNNHLRVGNDDAPLKLELFINVSCPGSAKAHIFGKEIFQEYIEKGQLQVIVKLWDKPREELLHGTLIHLSLDNSKPEEALAIVFKLLETQPEWLGLSDKELKQLLINEYQLQEEERLENVDISLAITQEAIERGIQFVPTMFINGEKLYLPYPFKLETEAPYLKDYIEEALTKFNIVN